MLLRGLASSPALNLAPFLASCSSGLCSQLAASSSSSPISDPRSSSNRSSADGAQFSTCASSSSSSSSSSSATVTSRRPRKTGFPGGVWNLHKAEQQVNKEQQQRPPRSNPPYFNPEDGPAAYEYWEDLWRQSSPRRKRVIPRQAPLYLEPAQEAALCAAAVAAGVPKEVVYGDMSRRQTPRLITAVYAHRPTFAVLRHAHLNSLPLEQQQGVPSTPAALTARIQQLMDLERHIPGLDVLRIFKTFGFELLATPPSTVAESIKALGKELQASGVAAEPGLLFTAAPRVALLSRADIVSRAQELPALYHECMGASAPSSLLSNHFQALLLGRSSKVVKRHIQALEERHGPSDAAHLATKLPQLLHLRPKTLDIKTAALAQGLGLQLPEDLQVVKNLVRRQPRLLTRSPQVLEARLQGLRELLGLEGQEELLKVVKKQPSLLYKHPETLAGKLAYLQQMLDISSDAATALAKWNPKLLCFSTEGLSRPLVCLQQISDDSALLPAKTKAAQVCLQRPALLSMAGESKASLGQRLQLLEQLAGTSPAWRARVAELVAGDQVELLADVLRHKRMWQRLNWVLQQARAKQQQQRGEAAPGLILQLLQMSPKTFDKQYPGFIVWQQEQQEAAAAAAEAARQQPAADS